MAAARGCVLRMALAVVALAAAVTALDNGLALTPPMGFANWNGFGCNYNDTTFRQIAQTMVANGMRDAGYTTLIIQECITPAGHRDPQTGVPQPDPEKFPHGIKDLCDYLHSLGFKCGIYTDVGPYTCAKYEGSFGYEQVDAQTYASWGIDFVEQDSCYRPNLSYHTLYTRMRDALNATGRPIVFYLCVQGQDDVYQWGPSVGNLWRTTGDICAPGHANWGGVVRNFKGDTRWPNATAPGGWQDPDMLMVGMPGLTENEWRTHFTLWCMAAAPLWAGIDLTKMPPGALEVFLNKDLIAVDQDKLGIMATMVPSETMGAGELALVDCSDATVWNHTGTTHTSIRAEAGCIARKHCHALSHVVDIVDCSSSHPCPNATSFSFMNVSLAAPGPPQATQIVSDVDHTCLVAGEVLKTATCDSSAAQQWVAGPAGKIRSASQGTCLGLASTASRRATATTPTQVWVKPLTKGPSGQTRVAVALFNPDDTQTQTASFTLQQVGLAAGKPAAVRDLWTHTANGTITSGLTAHVGSHGIVALLLEQ